MNPKAYRQQVEQDLRAAGPSAPAGGPDWAGDLAILADTARDARAREEALWRLQAGSFLPNRFAPYRGDYVRALQTALTDGDDGLRHAAFDILANLKDDFARRKLAEGLEDAARALVSPAVALGLLARDDHGLATGFARALIEGANDVATRAQAARVLAADPGSADLLAARMGDKDEFREVRRASAVSLQALDQERFRSLAEGILADEGDYSDIKATVGGALAREEAQAGAAMMP